MLILKRIILMLQFLTSIPLPFKFDVKNEDFGKGLVFAPIIGFFIGGILAGTYFLLNFIFPLYIISILILIEYILLTGGLHLDGLGDTFDGLFSNRPKERILEIMRDSRVGTNAVLAIVCVLILNVFLLFGMGSDFIAKALLLLPVAGRIGSLVGAGVSKYARSGEGLGKSFIDYCGTKEILIGLIFYFAIFFIVDNIRGLIISIFPVITAVLLVKYFSRKIGGATGDILGAVCELNQTIFLMVMYIIIQAMG
jgi:adenosylcobinamide-GDP ribazoletransferase